MSIKDIIKSVNGLTKPINICSITVLLYSSGRNSLIDVKPCCVLKSQLTKPILRSQRTSNVINES